MRRTLLVFLSALGIATAIGLAWHAQTADASGRHRPPHASPRPDGGAADIDLVMPTAHFEGY